MEDIDQNLEDRLKKFAKMKFKWGERFKIIADFLIGPQLTGLIENSNKIHTIQFVKKDGGAIDYLYVYTVKDKRPGFWYNFSKFFNPYQNVVKVYCNGHLFICEYYKHSYFTLADRIRLDYEEKLHSAFTYDFVILSKVG